VASFDALRGWLNEFAARKLKCIYIFSKTFRANLVVYIFFVPYPTRFGLINLSQLTIFVAVAAT